VKSHLMRRTFWRLAVVVLSGGLLLNCGGCPVDTDSVVTATVEASLTAVVSSLVDALSAYLAGT